MVTDLQFAVPIGRRWQFSLRAVLVTVLFLALALTDFRLRGGAWTHILPVTLTAFSAIIIIGLWTETRDLRFRLSKDLSSDQRWGLRFAIAWRIGAAFLLVLYHVVEHFDAKLFELQDNLFVGWPIRIVYVLALIIVLSNTRQMSGRRTESPMSTWRKSLLWILSITLVSAFLYLLLSLHFLVHIALCGIEMARPARDVPLLEGIDPLPITRGEPAFWLAVSTATLIPVNFWLIYRSVRDTGSPPQRRWCSALFVVSFLAMTGLFGWNYFVALPLAAPFELAEAPQAGIWHFLLIGAPCCVVIVTVLAYRFSARRNPAHVVLAPTPNLTPYLHERRWLSAGLAMMLAAPAVIDIAPEAWRLLGAISFSSMAVWLGLADLIGNRILADDTSLALLAAVIAAVTATFAGWRKRSLLPPAAIADLPIARFTFAWVAIAATTLISLPALAIYGFALWMAFWYLGDWPSFLGV